MSKKIEFMRSDLYNDEQISRAKEFLEPIFSNDGDVFKKMLQDGTAYIEGKSFTYVTDKEKRIRYRLMGNCVGPVIYIRDILPMDGE